MIAFDTETEVVDITKTVPDMVCLSASDGERSVVVFPDRVCEFLLKHRTVKRAAAWNLGFDWWVINYEIGRIQSHRDKMLEAVERGQFGDTMLLDQLVRLAEGKDPICFGRSLKKAAKEYLGIDVEKDEDLRTGFKREMADRWSDPSLRKGWKYAAEDARVTFEIDKILRQRAEQASKLLPFSHDAGKGWGLLTEQIQVKAAIVLAQITRNGIGADTKVVDELATRTKAQADEALSQLQSALGPGFIKRWKKNPRTGEVKETGSGLPQLNKALVTKELDRLAKLNDLDPPRTEKSKKPTDSAEWWTANCPDEPFVKTWQAYTTAAKLFQMVEGLVGKDRVHAEYRTLVRSGRTSSHSPNIQNQDREHRDMFVASPGHVLGAFDFSAIELVTLAAVCYERLGRSALGDVLVRGVDPHTHTACLVRGIDLDEFGRLAPGDRKNYRQSAKALNFGIPGGLGAKKLVGYAKANFGVDFTHDQAVDLRRRVVSEVYPEWEEWLRDGLATRLSYSLGCPLKEAERVFGQDPPYLDPMEHPSVRVMAGFKTKKDGLKFSPYFLEETWQSLEHCVESGDGRCPDSYVSAVYDRSPDPGLAEALVAIPCVTLTGRSRKKVYYGEFRNTQFQGLAADGAKLALWELLVANYKIVAFVHDEVVIEFPESEAEDGARRVVEIMSRAFRPVLGPKGQSIPVIVKHDLGRTWVKP